MAGFLFHEVVFGPVRSRRLGLSLGINLLPRHSKFCSFNCIYCECGWTPPGSGKELDLPTKEEVSRFLEQRLRELHESDYLPDAITYAGNGEPTLHPDFAGIVDITLALRNRYAPEALVSVLSNGSRTSDPKVFDALLKLDRNIQKLDCGSEKIFALMNNPVEAIKFDELVENLKKFDGRVIIQSMFLRGKFRGEIIDNTTSVEVNLWIERLKEIKPESVMIYPVARETPVHNLEKIPFRELEQIAARARAQGLKVEVYA
jgi:wyosine [tRNA(Phe)-imidazoG37] synthetase (radical SAM superfamily)